MILHVRRKIILNYVQLIVYTNFYTIFTTFEEIYFYACLYILKQYSIYQGCAEINVMASVTVLTDLRMAFTFSFSLFTPSFWKFHSKGRI